MVTGFRKYCIATVVDGSDDGMLWNDSEKDGDVRSECKEGENTDCEDGE